MDLPIALRSGGAERSPGRDGGGRPRRLLRAVRSQSALASASPSGGRPARSCPVGTASRPARCPLPRHAARRAELSDLLPRGGRGRLYSRLPGRARAARTHGRGRGPLGRRDLDLLVSVAAAGAAPVRLSSPTVTRVVPTTARGSWARCPRGVHRVGATAVRAPVAELARRSASRVGAAEVTGGNPLLVTVLGAGDSGVP